MKKIYLFVFLSISSFAFAQAPLLTEDFNYTAGDALTDHGWAIHSATTNPIVVTSPGLNFSGYVGSGIGNAAGVNNTGIDENKLFGAQTAAGSIYASFLVNATATSATGDYFFHIFDPTAVTSHRGRVFILPSTDAGKMFIGFSFNASAAQATMSTQLNFGETYLCVVKYTILDAALNDNVSLYVFKAGDDFSTEPATPTLGPLASLDSKADIVPTGVALRQFDAAQRITVDGIRVKTYWQLDKDVLTNINSINANIPIEFYPNPVTSGYINLVGFDNKSKEVEVCDIVGKKVINMQTLSKRIDVSSLNSGIYILKVSVDNLTQSSKFVIK